MAKELFPNILQRIRANTASSNNKRLNSWATFFQCPVGLGGYHLAGTLVCTWRRCSARMVCRARCGHTCEVRQTGHPRGSDDVASHDFAVPRDHWSPVGAMHYVKGLQMRVISRNRFLSTVAPKLDRVTNVLYDRVMLPNWTLCVQLRHNASTTTRASPVLRILRENAPGRAIRNRQEVFLER